MLSLTPSPCNDASKTRRIHFHSTHFHQIILGFRWFSAPSTTSPLCTFHSSARGHVQRRARRVPAHDARGGPPRLHQGRRARPAEGVPRQRLLLPRLRGRHVRPQLRRPQSLKEGRTVGTEPPRFGRDGCFDVGLGSISDEVGHVYL